MLDSVVVYLGLALVFVGLLSLIGLVVYYAVEVVERLAIPWHVSQQASAKDAAL